MTLAEGVDQGCVIAATIGPILFVLRWERWGVLLGAIYAWLILIVAGEALSALDPAREGGMVDGLWVLFGWVGTLIYSALIYAVVHFIRALWSRRSGRSRASEL